MAAEPPVSRPNRTWHAGTAKPTAVVQTPMGRRRRKIFIVLAAMLALVGAIAAWLLFLRPFTEPEFLTIAITNYRDRAYPVNAFAEEDSEALRKHFQQGAHARDQQEHDKLKTELEKLQAVTAKAKVVHLCGFARVYQEKLYLLPADASFAEASRDWLAMEEVLKALEKCPAEHKLLILDIAHPLDDPWQITPPEDIAGRFEQLFRQKARPGLLVLCACSPGQVSLLPEELPLSLFGYYLDKGLRGDADGYNEDRKLDERVSVKELAAFVKVRVDRWAIRNRGLRQTPVLLGEADDFDLVPVEQGEGVEGQAHSERPYPPLLKKGWEERDRAIDRGTLRLAPHLVQPFEAELLRQEHQWQGGDPNRDDRELAKRVEEFKNNVKTALDVIPAPEKYRSLFLEAALGRVKTDPKVDKALRARFKKLDGFKPAERAAMGAALVQEFTAETAKVPANVVAWTLLEAVLGEDPVATERYHFQFLNDLLKARILVPAYAELVYFQRLAELKLEDKDWPKAVIRRLFEVVAARRDIFSGVTGARATHALRAREFAWVRQGLEEAGDQQLDGEAQLFGGDPEQLTAAQETLSKARGGYSDVRDHLRTIQFAQATLDQGQRLLPEYVPYLVAQSPGQGGEALGTWLDALKELRTLAGVLAQPLDDKALTAEEYREKLDRLDRAARLLSNYLADDGLRRPVRPVDLARDLGGLEGDVTKEVTQRALQALGDMDAILQTPWPLARERLALLDSRKRLAARLHEKTRALDRADNAAHAWSRLPDDAPAESVIDTRKQRTLRANLSIQLLRLTGLPIEAANELETQAQQAARGGQAAAWAKFTAKLKKAWDDRQQAVRGEVHWAEAALLGQVLSPQTGLGPGDLGNPTGKLRRHEAVVYWRWQAQRAKKQGEALSDVPAYKDLFQQLEIDYQTAADKVRHE
jgi:hypothetical protein